MRILRVAARLVMCGSSVSMSWRAAKTSLPPGFAWANASALQASVASTSSARIVVFIMLISPRSRAQRVCGVRDRPRGDHQIFQRHTLVRRGPLLVDANVARTVLHGRDAVGHQNVAVADVAEPSPAAHRRRHAAGEPLALGQ